MPDGNTGGTQISDPSGNVSIGTGAPVSSLPSSNTGSTSVSADASVETAISVGILGGLVNPASVEERRPGTPGAGVQAFLLRRLERLEGRIARLESVQ